jgi:hypothetical protein
MRSGTVQYIICMLLFCTAGISHAQEVRAVPDSVVRQMKNEKEFLYANDASLWKQEDHSSLFKWMSLLADSPWLKWVLFVLLAAALTFVVYQVIVANNFFTPSRRKKKSASPARDENEMPENIEESIAAAIASGEYRLATRFYYLKTLSLLSAANKIKLHARSTNYDYLLQMKEYPNVKDFGRLTAAYEYVWYGQFQPDATQFETIRSGFNQFNQHL